MPAVRHEALDRRAYAIQNLVYPLLSGDAANAAILIFGIGHNVGQALDADYLMNLLHVIG
ncbi:Uncharacterised protein [uncultured archaeon]|nr:Uncharacterised protein [uncultured archaeon]